MVTTHIHIHMPTDDDWSPEAREAAAKAREQVVKNRQAAPRLGPKAGPSQIGTNGNAARMAVVAARRAQKP
jgi:hypothetical protein